MNIETNCVHIWYMEFNNTGLLEETELIKFLNEEEKNKANSFLKIKDRKNYICSHGYLRILLTKYYPEIKPHEWEFSINKYGKPSLSEEYKFNLFFNMSHTDSFVAFIFDISHACGIDIEEDKGMVINNEMIDLVLSRGEKNLYNKCIDKKSFFYRLWVLKESYVKALGTGLSYPIDEIDFSTIKDIEINKDLSFIKSEKQLGMYMIFYKIYLSYCIQKSKDIKFYGCKDI